MACSKPLNFENVIDITRCPRKLTEFLSDHNLLFSFNGPCSVCGCGRLILRIDHSTRDGFTWRCTNWRCSHKVSFRKYSFFTGSKLPLATVIKIIYYWTYKYTQDIVLHETGLSPHTVVDFYNFLREVCCVILQEQSEPIGGPGKVVEIDESKFGKRKYNKGKRVEGQWVFGGIERDSCPTKCFFVPVDDRSAATLIPIITKWILPETTIASDCWKAYSSLQAEGYIHETVNHKLNFVSEAGTHTNNIESRWRALKGSLPRYGTRKQFYSSYFSEYCIRRKFIDCASDKFIAVLDLVSEIYKPDHPITAGPSLAAQISELLSAQQDTAAGAAADTDLLPQAQPIAQAPPQALPQAPEPTVNTDANTAFTSADVGNFDIGFHMSSQSDDNNSDIDLFL